MKGGVERDEGIEEECPRRVEPVPGVLGCGQKGDEGDQGRERAPERWAFGRAPGSPGPEAREVGPENQRGEDGGSRDQAQPIGAGTKGGPQREHQGAVDGHAEGPLGPDPGSYEGQEGEEQPGQNDRAGGVETQSGLEFTWDRPLC